MLELTKILFERYGFKTFEFKNGLFCESANENREQYWLVIKVTDKIDSVLEQQAFNFNECKKICSEPGVDKNLSMLVLWETDGSVPREQFKKNKMKIEEDPYFFKKYVLGYAAKELQQLQNQIAERDIAKFIEDGIVSKQIFDDYKNDPYVKTWQSLIYRLAIKLPFIKINIGESQGLQSLLEEHDKALAKDGMLDVNKSLMTVLDKVSSGDIKNMKPSEFYKLLWPFFEGDQNGH